MKIGNKVPRSFVILRAAGGTHGIARSFNDRQQVIWQATFIDGSQSVITTEVP